MCSCRGNGCTSNKTKFSVTPSPRNPRSRSYRDRLKNFCRQPTLTYLLPYFPTYLLNVGDGGTPPSTFRLSFRVPSLVRGPFHSGPLLKRRVPTLPNRGPMRTGAGTQCQHHTLCTFRGTPSSIPTVTVCSRSTLHESRHWGLLRRCSFPQTKYWCRVPRCVGWVLLSQTKVLFFSGFRAPVLFIRFTYLPIYLVKYNFQ